MSEMPPGLPRHPIGTFAFLGAYLLLFVLGWFAIFRGFAVVTGRRAVNYLGIRADFTFDRTLLRLDLIDVRIILRLGRDIVVVRRWRLAIVTVGRRSYRLRAFGVRSLVIGRWRCGSVRGWRAVIEQALEW